MNQATDSSVSFFDDFLSSFATKHSTLFRRLGSIENFFNRHVFERKIEKPVFITGLARSGTTILLEILSSHKDSACHKYRDFPFLQVPIWWNWFVNHASKEDEAIERFHKDRILITKESPEAMEEVLWMNFFQSCHDPNQQHVVLKTTAHDKFEEYYKKHINKILYLRKGKRYLAKNNYNLTRLDLITSMFEDCRILIMVREPVSHIFSLVKQHKLFCKEEENDKRVLNYMNRVGHFEFGLNRAPINLAEEDKNREVVSAWNKGDEILGYALLWRNVYRFIVDRIKDSDLIRNACLVVSYENLCANAYDTLQRIYAHAELECDAETLQMHADKLSLPGYYKIDFSETDLRKIEDVTGDIERQVKALISPA